MRRGYGGQASVCLREVEYTALKRASARRSSLDIVSWSRIGAREHTDGQ